VIGLGAELAELVVKIGADGAGFVAGLIGVENKLIEVSHHVLHLGEAMTLSLTAPLAGFETASIVAFTNFDNAMVRSSTTFAGLSAGMQQQMGDMAKALSGETEFSATELAATFRDLGQAQMSPAEAMKSLQQNAAFATAGMEEIGQATKQIIDVQGALGLRSQSVSEDLANQAHIEDVLTKATLISHTSVESLSGALTSRLGPVLRSLHVPLEDAVGVLTLFARQGQSVEQTGARLTLMLQQLQRGALQNKEVFDKLLGPGAVFDQAGKIRPLVDIFASLDHALAGASDQQKAVILTQLGFQGRMQATVTALLGQSDALKKLQNELKNSQGTTEQVADVIENTFGAQLEHLEHRIKNVGIAIGEMLVPYMKMLVSWIDTAIGWWNDLSASTQRFIIGAAAIATVVGPGLVLLSGLGTVIGVAFGVVVAVLGALFSPIGLVIAGVTSILLVVVGPKGLAEAFTYLGSIINTVFNVIYGFFYNFKENVVVLTYWAMDVWNTTWTYIETLVLNTMNVIIDIVNKAYKRIFSTDLQGWLEWAAKLLGASDFAAYIKSVAEIQGMASSMALPGEAGGITAPKLNLGVPTVGAGEQGKEGKFNIDTSGLNDFVQGFTGPDGALEGFNTLGKSMKQDFSATTLGTAEEYKARVQGQGPETIARSALDVAKLSLTEQKQFNTGINNMTEAVKALGLASGLLPANLTS
jgi:TP901 family phage tail tape measure protein